MQKPDILKDGRKLGIFIHSELDDAGLSPQEFRVYAHLARRAGSHNEAWPSIESMADKCKICKQNVISAIKVLEAVGMISAAREAGRSTVYSLTESKEWVDVTDEIRKRFDYHENAPTSSRGEPVHVVNYTSSRGEHKGTPVEGTPNVYKPMSSGELAEKVYQAYPRKTGKLAAIRKIKESLCRFDADEIIDATKAYAAAVALWPAEDQCFVPMPATWFHQGRFLDDRSTWVRQAKTPNPAQSTSAQIKALENDLENVGGSVVNNPEETARRDAKRKSIVAQIRQLQGRNE